MGIFNKREEKFEILNNQTGKKDLLDFGVICNFADILSAYDDNNVMNTTLQYIEAKKNNNEKEYLKKITEAEFVKYFNKEGKSIEHTDKVRNLVCNASYILSQLSRAYTRHKCFDKFIHTNIQNQYIQEILDNLEKGNKDPRKYLESFLDAEDIIGKEAMDAGISTYKEHYKTSIKEFIISGDKSDISMLFYNRISGRPDKPYKLLTQEELQEAIRDGFNKRCHNKLESFISQKDISEERLGHKDTKFMSDIYSNEGPTGDLFGKLINLKSETLDEIESFNHIQDNRSATEIKKILRTEWMEYGKYKEMILKSSVGSDDLASLFECTILDY